MFIETQLAGIEGRFEHEHLLEVIRKTARKMSPKAIGLIATMPLPQRAADLLAEALA